MGVQHFDVIIVGAGFGGIGAAIQLNRLGYDNIVIVDREDDLGGTWHVNRYPGLSVDQPSPTFSYWFEPNPYWSRLYAPGAELKRYAEHVADKYNVRRYMRFNTTVEGARWDDDAQVWRVALAGGETLSAQFLIAATGFLCQPRLRILPVSRRSVDASSTPPPGMTAIRLPAAARQSSEPVPPVCRSFPSWPRKSSELTVYQRTPIWVLPKLDVVFPPVVQRLFARLPLTQRIVRWFTDTSLEFMMVITMWKYRYFKLVNKAISGASKIYRLLLVRDKELSRKLNPDFDFGCKRPTISNSYYRAFTKPHVHLETGGIERIEPDGIVARDGTKRFIDTLVLATGFDVWDANLPAIEVIGREGRNLGKWWRETRFQAYEGISVPYFPNFLTMASPYAWVGLSWFNTVEYQMRHMNRLFGELQRRGARTFEITEQANARFLDRMTTLLEDSAFHLGSCATSRSYWFRNNTGKGEAPLFRPTSVRSAVKEQERFPLSDYAIA